MAHRKVSIWKYVKMGARWQYKAAAYGPNGKIKPDVVIVDKTHQYHPEGNYYLRLSAGKGGWKKIGPKSGGRHSLKILKRRSSPQKPWVFQ